MLDSSSGGTCPLEEVARSSRAAVQHPGPELVPHTAVNLASPSAAAESSANTYDAQSASAKATEVWSRILLIFLVTRD